ncbi:MAG: bifunctional adenosylcobinamide kinase/adenosylcobinamide-phosphate guanylyltransferase [Prevotella sp.]
MILVIGGIASGKRTFVRSLGYTDEQISPLPAADAPVLLGLEELLRQGALSEQDLQALKAKDVVICCEVGLGVVPIDADERAWRELVGRTCAQLAAEAEQVVRMVCGIPIRLR